MRRFKRMIRKYTRKLYALSDKLPKRLRFLPFCIPLAPVALAALLAALLLGGKGSSSPAVVQRASISLPSAAPQAPLSDTGTVVIEAPSPSFTPELSPAPPVPTPTPDPTLRRGDENENVTKLQQRLIKLGFLDIDEPTLLFGRATQDAVKRVQRQADIEQTGVADIEFLNLLYADGAPKYVMKEGMSGDDIQEMQQQLIDLGYLSKATGYFGDETIAALKEFQSRNKLSVDGLAGEQTISLLYSDDAKPSASKAKEARRKANIDDMISTAKKMLGKDYSLGKTGPNSFDCSGLVYYCLKTAGSNRRRLNAAGYSGVSDWEKITSIDKLKKGDLIFFYDDGMKRVGHVGIIVSSTEMIDASSRNDKVMRRSYKSAYWKKHFVCGRRPW